MNVEIIALIYKSVDYLNFITNQLKKHCQSNYHNVSVKIVANDPTPTIIEHLKTLDIPYVIYNDPKPNDYYINRVYRCYNWAGQNSPYENVCFVNSDMAFSDGWIDNLMKHHDGVNIPTSRLVESGKMLSGMYAISKNVGQHPKQFNQDDWQQYSNSISEDIVKEGGLYMPCVFNTLLFKQCGGYPEGNVIVDNNGKYLHIKQFNIPHKGKLISGDNYLFLQLQNKYKMKHVTVFDSLVYHIQEGEKDD